jgi:short-chain fatty acids transporter
MVSRLGLFISRVFRIVVPDPFVIAVLLTVLTALLAVTFGYSGNLGDRLVRLLDAWRFADQSFEGKPVAAADRVGIWKLLEFSMQMCLILVTGHALASTRPVQWLIRRLADLPQSAGSAAAMVGFVACVTGWINWGLGLIVGALLAREVGRSMSRRGVLAHYPLLCAAGYFGLMIWHGGLSGSAPLAVTTLKGAAGVLPAEYVAKLGAQGIPLHETLFSPLNLFVSGGMLIIVPVMLLLLAPKDERHLRPIDEFNVEPERTAGPVAEATIPDWLERTGWVSRIMGVMFLLALARYVQVTGVARIGLNEVNAAMLGLGLMLHDSPRAYMTAAEEGARGCLGIMVQFPLYAGIMAMILDAGLVDQIAGMFSAHGTAKSVPLFSFLAACIVNLFIPSGGGQWAVQGPIALQAGIDVGVAPAKMVMSVAYGDQITNMLQVFWALPLLAVTGVKARDIVGYTAIVMVVAGAWVALGLLLF